MVWRREPGHGSDCGDERLSTMTGVMMSAAKMKVPALLVVAVLAMLGVGSSPASAADGAPPPDAILLQSVRLISAPVDVSHRGTPSLEVTLAAPPAYGQPITVAVTWVDEITGGLLPGLETAIAGATTINVPINLSDRVTRLRLDSVRLAQQDRNHPSGQAYTNYARSSTASFSTTLGGQEWVYWAHSVDLSQGDIVLRPEKPIPGMTTALSHGAYKEFAFTHEQQYKGQHFGVETTISPGGRVVRTPSNPLNGDYAAASISGLTNGVTYTMSSSFIGTEGIPSAPVVWTVRPMLSTRVFSPGDTTGDGKPDIVAGAHRASDLLPTVVQYTGDGRGHITGLRSQPMDIIGNIAPAGPLLQWTRPSWHVWDPKYPRLYRWTRELNDDLDVGGGWGAMPFFDGGCWWPDPENLSDRNAVVLSVSSTGALRVNRYLEPSVIINSGWGGFHAFLCPGDASGDKVPDILAVDSAGVMWLYRGNGRGGLIPGRSAVGSGWSGMGGVFPLRDWNGDGRNDIGGITMTGELYLYAGTGRGTFPVRTLVGKGWTKFL